MSTNTDTLDCLKHATDKAAPLFSVRHAVYSFFTFSVIFLLVFFTIYYYFERPYLSTADRALDLSESISNDLVVVSTAIKTCSSTDVALDLHCVVNVALSAKHSTAKYQVVKFLIENKQLELSQSDLSALIQSGISTANKEYAQASRLRTDLLKHHQNSIFLQDDIEFPNDQLIAEIDLLQRTLLLQVFFFSQVENDFDALRK